MFKFLLCSRYLTTRYIALVSIVSVMLGVATMIVVNSVMGGFREKMRERLHGILADVVVESTTMDGFRDPDAVMDHIRATVGDKVVAMTPAIEVFAMLTYKNQGQGPDFTRPVRLVGIDPSGRAEVGEFSSHLENKENRAQPSFALRDNARQWREAHPELAPPEGVLEPEGAIIGYQIATFRGHGMTADQYIIHPGQNVIVTTVKAGTPPKPVDSPFVVSDLYKSDMSEYDSNYVFVPYRELQRLRSMGNAATSIQIRLRDYAEAPGVVKALEAAFPRMYFQVQTWEQKQGPLLQAVQVEAFILNVILSFIIAVAGFGILAIFFMIVVEKTRDIGVLKALGASDGGVMGIFVGYGLVLGLVGCGLGSAFGISFTVYINEVEQILAALTGREMFPRDIYYFPSIPVVLDPATIGWINLGAVAIAVAASVLPARRAAMLNPVEALRNE